MDSFDKFKDDLEKELAEFDIIAIRDDLESIKSRIHTQIESLYLMIERLEASISLLEEGPLYSEWKYPIIEQILSLKKLNPSSFWECKASKRTVWRPTSLDIINTTFTYRYRQVISAPPKKK